MSELKDIQAGDEVALFEPNALGYGNQGVSIKRVERVTPTQIIVNGTRYRRQDGRAVGDTDYWYHVYIDLATAENRVRAEHQELIAARRRQLTAMREQLVNIQVHPDWLARLNHGSIAAADAAIQRLWDESAKEAKP